MTMGAHTAVEIQDSEPAAGIVSSVDESFLVETEGGVGPYQRVRSSQIVVETPFHTTTSR